MPPPILSTLTRLARRPWSGALFLLFLCLAAYGTLIPQLGLYWDDYPIGWIAQHYGSPGITRYFSTNRPVWGWLYQLTTPLLGTVPWRWQVLALLARWGSGLALWALLREALPRRPFFALTAAALFVLYPGFRQQFIALVYSHFFIVLAAFLLSLWLPLRARRLTGPPRAALLAAALLLAAYNLAAMEYFFLLELLRPFILRYSPADRPPRAWRAALLEWAPFAALLAAGLVWRLALNPNQTTNYELSLFERLGQDFFAGAWYLVSQAASALWQTVIAAAGLLLDFPAPTQMGPRTFGLYIALMLLVLLAAGAYLWLRQGNSTEERLPAGVWLLGGAALLLAGLPFYLTGLQVNLTFPTDRFTLPFAPGWALLAAALLALVRRPVPRLALTALALALAVSVQLQAGARYRQAWSDQQSFFWQLAWRAPAIQPGTTLLTNDLPLGYYSDNSLTAPLNAVYAPDNRSDRLRYLLFWPSIRFREEVVPGHALELDYLAASFSGSTDQMAALYFQPPGCLRVLDPELDPENGMLPDSLRQASRLSRPELLLAEGSPDLPPAWFGPEPSRRWCYYFQKASLAASAGDWPAVAQLGDEALALGDYPNDPMERLVFVEGFAQVGRWEAALEQSQAAGAVTPLMQPVLCRLWERIERETPGSPSRASTLAEARAGCR